MFDAQNIGAFIVTVVTLPFVIILLVLILILARSVRTAHASRRWTPSDGRIASSEVTSHRSLDSNGTHTTIYEPAVSYVYNANGRNYEGKQVDFGAIAGTSSPGWAENMVDKYPVGSPVQVFYNPAKPDQAVLEHSGKATGTLVLMGILIAVELLLIGLMVFGWTGHFA